MSDEASERYRALGANAFADADMHDALAQSSSWGLGALHQTVANALRNVGMAYQRLASGGK